jgi:hypothetical protein
MISYINYYYDLYPVTINEIEESFMFYINSEKYYFIPYDRNMEEVDELVKLNKKMIEKGSLVSEIISNKFNDVVNNYNGKLYVLIRVYVNDSKNVSVEDVIYMINEFEVDDSYKIISRTNWSKLWEDKVDYFEYQMGHLIKKYPILYNTIDYYLGISENAIFYLKNVVSKYDGNVSLGVSHRRIGINYTLFDLYNPLNLIIDYKVRDIAEYIKDAFFNGSDVNNILNVIYSNYYFDKLNLSLLLSRFLFPSYFYDLFEDIVYKGENESNIYEIIKKSSIFEDFIDIFIKSCNLQSISWITR